jgi:hypothetical protein
MRSLFGSFEVAERNEGPGSSERAAVNATAVLASRLWSVDGEIGKLHGPDMSYLHGACVSHQLRRLRNSSTCSASAAESSPPPVSLDVKRFLPRVNRLASYQARRRSHDVR